MIKETFTIFGQLIRKNFYYQLEGTISDKTATILLCITMLLLLPKYSIFYNEVFLEKRFLRFSVKEFFQR
ncbi:recQ-mediated genome instability protein 1-like isoform X3, partial [Vespula squamosa]